METFSKHRHKSQFPSQLLHIWLGLQTCRRPTAQVLLSPSRQWQISQAACKSVCWVYKHKEESKLLLFLPRSGLACTLALEICLPPQNVNDFRKNLDRTHGMSIRSHAPSVKLPQGNDVVYLQCHHRSTKVTTMFY